MSKYPYNETEHFPMTEEKRRVYDEYTTRSVKSVLPRIGNVLIKIDIKTDTRQLANNQ